MRKLLLTLTLAVVVGCPSVTRAAQFYNSLWLGTDNTSALPVLNVDQTGTELRRVDTTEATGIAIDAAANRIYFGVSQGGLITVRDLNDPATPLATLQTDIQAGEDMAFDGAYLWCADNGTRRVVQIDPRTGATVFSFDPGFYPLGIAWDGHNLWVSEYNGFLGNELIQQFTPAGVATGAQFHVPQAIPAAGGLAVDPTDGTLWIGTFGAVFHITTDGTVLESFLTPDYRFVDGLEFQAAPAGCTSAVCMVQDKAAFVAATQATAVTGTDGNGNPLPLPDLGAVQGGVTIGGVTVQGQQLAVGTRGIAGVTNNDWTLLLPGPDIALAGPGPVKRVELTFAQPVYAVGIDMVEPQTGPNVGPRFSEATFRIDLKRGKQLVQTLEFNPANDVAAFVGVWTDIPFDTMTFKAHAFGTKILGIPRVSVVPVFLRPIPDIVVIDENAGTRGKLFRVEVDGSRSVLNDFGDGSQGQPGRNPTGVAMEATGNILVTDADYGADKRGALFRVDPMTKIRTILNDFNDPTQGDPSQVQRGLGVEPVGVAVEANGNILVVDKEAGTNNEGALFRVNAKTGKRSLLSDFGRGQNQGGAPVGVAVEATGNILVICITGGTNTNGPTGALFRVNPNTGNRTRFSDFGNSGQGTGGEDPKGVAVEANGTILVTRNGGSLGGRGVLVRVNPSSGVRTVVNNFADPSQGQGGVLGMTPLGVAVRANGDILVIDANAGINNRGTLFRVDPVTELRTVLSDFNDPRQGPLGVEPVGVAVRKH